MNGYIENKGALLARLARIEGQVGGLSRMVEADKYCIDVLTQISATTRALQAVALELLDDHLKHCVIEAAAQGGQLAEEKVREATAAITRLVKS
ncbi:MAG: CsoR family transcriptional regulator, copper-sensing transcriptional repressor [Pseudonocardiales bacterium]|jgi:DNA-binding FrmR family transcriptional regulator|nr:CsoR family transcriptional regulator, copper-sensing transcriptional repressor [Pseudonocardiales bacterium]